MKTIDNKKILPLIFTTSGLNALKLLNYDIHTNIKNSNTIKGMR